MDPAKFIPAAPITSDPITWIALTAFVVLVSVFAWLVLFGAPKAMTALREERERALAKFSEEQDKQREHDSERSAAIYARLDNINREVTTISARLN